MNCGARGFTLVEVIVALGILGGGLLVVMGMFAPLARADAENDGRLGAMTAAAAVNEYLRTLPFGDVPMAMEQTFFVSRSSAQVGLAADPIWQGQEQRKFFAVTMQGGRDASGAAATRSWLSFVLRVRWPVTPAGAPGPREAVVAGSVHR